MSDAKHADFRPQVVVLDLGEVLASPSGLHEALAEELSCDLAPVHEAYWADRDLHDRGSAPEIYWAGVGQRLGIEVSQDLSRRLAEIDATIWSAIRPQAEAILTDLHHSGTKVAVLSNAPLPLAELARSREWAAYVDEWFFSCDLLIAKPDARIYQEVVGVLGVAPQDILFFDDRLENVEAARDAGWDAHLWVSDKETREALTNRGLL